MVERTLLNIKPGAVERNLVGEIIRRVEDHGYRILVIDKIRLYRDEVEAFYEVHRGKPFFEKLVDFMSSGYCVPMVVEGENAVDGIRELIGATDPKEAAEGTIRKDFAEDVTHNAVHASDSTENAAKEIAFFFPQRRLLG